MNWIALPLLWSVGSIYYHDFDDKLPAVAGDDVCLFQRFQLATSGVNGINGLLLRRLQSWHW